MTRVPSCCFGRPLLSSSKARRLTRQKSGSNTQATRANLQSTLDRYLPVPVPKASAEHHREEACSRWNRYCACTWVGSHGRRWWFLASQARCLPEAGAPWWLPDAGSAALPPPTTRELPCRELVAVSGGAQLFRHARHGPCSHAHINTNLLRVCTIGSETVLCTV